MSDPEALNDIRFLRDVVARTHPAEVNHFWPVSVGWGVVVTFGYLLCGIFAVNGRTKLIPWVWPALIMLVAFPLQMYLIRRVRLGMAEAGVRPRFRKDLMVCWLTIGCMGLLWTAGMVISGQIADHWGVLAFVWGTLYVVGYVMNGILVSREWFWAAGVMLASIVAAFLAGPRYYWLPGVWIGGTFLLGGLLGRRNARAFRA
ncbi:MAG: hypothetical protein ABJC09_14510 [Terriglobia bacterium]